MEKSGATGAGVAKTIAKWTKPPSSTKPEVKHVSFKHAKTSPVPSRSPSPVRSPSPNPDYECTYCGNPGHTKTKCALAKGGGTARLNQSQVLRNLLEALHHPKQQLSQKLKRASVSIVASMATLYETVLTMFKNIT